MNQNLPKGKLIGEFTFFKVPFMELYIAAKEIEMMTVLWQLMVTMVNNSGEAAEVLQVLIDRGRSAGLQLFIYVENPESALPEVHRLTHAISS